MKRNKMFYKKLLLIGTACCFVLNLAGCFSFGYGLSDDTANTLAEYLKMRENYWYVLDKNGFPVLFYNDFQDYTVIVKARGESDINIVYMRSSLNQALEKVAQDIKLPPECKGICTYFMYEGKKALFFDLDAFCYKYGAFHRFIINDGREGYIYSMLSKSYDHYYREFNLFDGAKHEFRILQAEPDFHLLDLSSVKRK